MFNERYTVRRLSAEIARAGREVIINSPATVFDTAQAATYIGVSVALLIKARAGFRDGPPYFKKDGSVLYRRKDIDRWMRDTGR